MMNFTAMLSVIFFDVKLKINDTFYSCKLKVQCNCCVAFNVSIKAWKTNEISLTSSWQNTSA